MRGTRLILGATGMTDRSEAKILTWSPDRGNPTPRRQGRWPRVRGPTWWCDPRWPVREGLVEAIGAWLRRTKVKRRKASSTGKLAHGSEALSLSVVARCIGDVLAAKSVSLTPGGLVGSAAKR
jgi:hypothetical protein